MLAILLLTPVPFANFQLYSAIYIMFLLVLQTQITHHLINVFFDLIPYSYCRATHEKMCLFQSYQLFFVSKEDISPLIFTNTCFLIQIAWLYHQNYVVKLSTFG